MTPPELLRRKQALLESVRKKAASSGKDNPAQQLRPSQGLTKIDLLRRRAELLRNPVSYQEIDRIVGLPLIREETKEEIERFNQEHVLAEAYKAGFRLWGVQCRGASGYSRTGGAFCPIGVGWGKTLLTQLIANIAYQKGLRKIMLLVPSGVLPQLVETDFPFARKRIPITYPVHVVGSRGPKARRQLAQSNKVGLYILSHQSLSNKDASDLLNWIGPELIICDEADGFGNPESARTKRLMSYVKERSPEGAALSGTITDKSIMDYYHLIKWCLGESCPLPLNGHLASEWAVKIDAGASSTEATGPILPLLEWAVGNFPGERITEDTAGFRAAYRLRLKSCPGVSASGDAEIKPSLVLHNMPVPSPEKSPGWDRLEDLRRGVIERWTTPNGDEIDHAIHTFKWLYELTAGFYNELIFPEVEAFAEDRSIDFRAAHELIEQARDHHTTVQKYAKSLRDWIEEKGRDKLDTPMLVGLEMHRNGAQNVGYDLYEAWLLQKESFSDLREAMLSHRAHHGSLEELDKEVGRSLRFSRVVRVCPYKIDHAVRWVQGQPKGKGLIVWVMHKGIGEWIVEALRQAGEDPLYCPAGPQGNQDILDPGNRKRRIVASVTAHGVGKNLQAFERQLYLQWPRNAKKAEQSLGRMHRNGQQAGTVWACTNTTTEFDQLCFAASLNDALYIHQSTGNRQKLIYADYSPGLPRVFPASVLRERGFQNRKLTPAQQELMAERFGGS